MTVFADIQTAMECKQQCEINKIATVPEPIT
jgi:hypothetical protein